MPAGAIGMIRCDRRVTEEISIGSCGLFFAFRKKYNAYNEKGEDLLMYNIWKPSYC